MPESASGLLLEATPKCRVVGGMTGIDIVSSCQREIYTAVLRSASGLLLQATVKCLASGVGGEMTPAAGVLTCIASHSEAARELIFAAKPAVLPNLLNALAMKSPSLAAAAVGKPSSVTETCVEISTLSPAWIVLWGLYDQLLGGNEQVFGLQW